MKNRSDSKWLLFAKTKGSGLILFLASLFLIYAPTLANAQISTAQAESSDSFDHKYSEWATLLTTYVKTQDNSTRVKYKELIKNIPTLSAFTHQLSLVSMSTYSNWNEKQKLSFLINAYNSLTLLHVAYHYPISSIRNIGGFYENPWKIEFFSLLGKKHHLDWIEHETIRKDFSEPRIHFALNCASIGCPPLRLEPYTADKLEQQLEEQTQNFLKDSSKNSIETKSNTLRLSKIFDTIPWFAEDFIKHSGSVLKFVAPYLTGDPILKQKVEAGEFKLEFNRYDWKLNEAK